MINTYFQTTEITDSGYKIIVSNNNKFSDDELASIFHNSEILKQSDDEFRFFPSGIALVKTGIQNDTGRSSQNILLINGIDRNQLKQSDEEKIKNLMTNFLNREFRNIKEEYINSEVSARKIIFVSSYFSEFEKKVNQLNLPEEKFDSLPNNNKSFRKYFIFGGIFLVIVTFFIGQIVLAGFKNKIKVGVKKVKEAINKTVTPKEKIPIEKQVCQVINFSDEEFEKAKAIEPDIAKRLLDTNQEDQISNSIKENMLPYVFCLPKDQSNIKKFYLLDSLNYEKVLKIRKMNIKLIQYIISFYQNMTQLKLNEKDYSVKTLDLDNKKYKPVHDYIKTIKDYYYKISQSYLDFSTFNEYTNAAFPIFSKKDSKVIESIKDFFCDNSFSYGYWTGNLESWQEISNISDLKKSIENIDLKNIEELKEKIIHRDGDEESVKKIISYIDLLINSKKDLLAILSSEIMGE